MKGMADSEDYQQCDMCGASSGVWIRFCEVCGFDYCDRCKLSHDAHHEFIEEAIGV